MIQCAVLSLGVHGVYSNPISADIWGLGLFRIGFIALDGFALSFLGTVKLRDRICVHLICSSLLSVFGQEMKT